VERAPKETPGRSLRRALAEGRFVVTGELGPPLGASPDAVRKKAGYFRGVVDAVNTTDNQTGIVRLSSIASAAILLDEGVDPIVQMTCRDRNRLALQSDILGATALGVSNLLLLTGDHMSMGDQPDAKPVFDLDSIQLIEMARGMREGRFMNGVEVRGAPDVLLGAAANPFAEPMGLRLIRLAKKAAAGAQFIQTQAVFDVPRFRRWMSGVRDLGLHERVKILVGVLPVRSERALLYMKNEVAGMSIPDDTIRRLRDASDPKEEGVRLACDLIDELRDVGGVSGVHIMPVMWESVTPRIVEESGLGTAGAGKAEPEGVQEL
jgi:methylenetetrahydrofolate reductase (NADPH)